MDASSTELAANVRDADRRRAERVEVALDVGIMDREGRSFPATIHNISETGIMATTTATLFERAPLRIDLPQIGWLRADVAWVLGNRFGAAFRERLRGDFVHNYAEQMLKPARAAQDGLQNAGG